LGIRCIPSILRRIPILYGIRHTVYDTRYTVVKYTVYGICCILLTCIPYTLIVYPFVYFYNDCLPIRILLQLGIQMSIQLKVFWGFCCCILSILLLRSWFPNPNPRDASCKPLIFSVLSQKWPSPEKVHLSGVSTHFWYWAYSTVVHWIDSSISLLTAWLAVP
jgi:hypothetical protein